MKSAFIEEKIHQILKITFKLKFLYYEGLEKYNFSNQIVFKKPDLQFHADSSLIS